MPTLRFSRDRRGYESTYLLHTSKRRSGPEQPRLLYWFRTPPHVKVGRAAFDEDAIRGLEQQHPDVEFDWDQILTTRPPAAPESRDPREARPARRPERRPVRESHRDQPRVLPPMTPAPPVAVPSPSDPVVEPPPPAVEAVAVQVTGTASRPARRFVRVFDAPAGTPAVPEHHASEPSVVGRLLGAEQLTVLRARHAEILARISARGGDPARQEALREQAVSVDPDGWVTESDVTAGLAAVDATLAELHRIVGRRRRRRRRQDGGTPHTPTHVGGTGGIPVAAEDAESPEGDDEAE